MKLETRSTGQLGESIARNYLEERGYRILEQNYRTRWAEIDLVASKNGTLVFVEVRTKIGEQFGTPEETLNRQKQWKILQNAKAYAAQKRYAGPYRIDAVCIVLSKGSEAERISHYENIASDL